MEKHKILLVDDHPIVREGLAQFINAEMDLVVTGMASSGLEAMDLLTADMPDLVVTDLSLSGKPGLELVKELATKHPSLPVLVLSIHDELLWAERVLRRGRGVHHEVAGDRADRCGHSSYSRRRGMGQRTGKCNPAAKAGAESQAAAGVAAGSAQ